MKQFNLAALAVALALAAGHDATAFRGTADRVQRVECDPQRRSERRRPRAC